MDRISVNLSNFRVVIMNSKRQVTWSRGTNSRLSAGTVAHCLYCCYTRVDWLVRTFFYIQIYGDTKANHFILA